MKLRRSLGVGIVASIVLLATGPVAAQERPPGGEQQAQQGQQGQQGQQAPPPQPAFPVFGPGPGFPPPEPLPTVALAQVLERVARNSNKQFLVDPRIPPQIYLGSVRLEDVNYPILLGILRIYGLAAATIDGRVNIVPDALIRSLPVPMVNTDDAKIPDDEWVQRVIVTNGDAPMLVPVLRPLMPQAAHFAAFMPNKLIIVDRYANVKRISALVKTLDR